MSDNFKNKTETFNRFNCGMRRPNRKRHLELCGFKLKATYIPSDLGYKPRELAKRQALQFNESMNKPCHVVYFIGERADGWPVYHFWVKGICDEG